jgi:predicted alpha-1,6-mannanase (GH76 family)
VLRGSGGGDGGLFSGITARYLALVATTLPGDSVDDVKARDTARHIVLTSAQSAWDNRQSVEGLPLFGPSWDETAELPTAGGQQAQFVGGAVTASEIPERDLSVQLSGWMLMEAAYAVTAADVDQGTSDE